MLCHSAQPPASISNCTHVRQGAGRDTGPPANCGFCTRGYHPCTHTSNIFPLVLLPAVTCFWLHSCVLCSPRLACLAILQHVAVWHIFLHSWCLCAARGMEKNLCASDLLAEKMWVCLITALIAAGQRGDSAMYWLS